MFSNVPHFTAEPIGQLSPLRKILLLGQCSLEYLVDKFPAGWVVQHHWMESRVNAILPALNFADYDAVIVAPTLRHVLQNSRDPDDSDYLAEHRWARMVGRDGMASYFEECSDAIKGLVEKLGIVAAKIPVFFLTFMEPRQNYLGILMPIFSLNNPVHFVRELNRVLETAVSNLPQAFCVEINEILNAVGRITAQDDIFFHFGHGSYIADHYITAEEDNERIQYSELPSRMYPYSEQLLQAQTMIAERIRDALMILSRRDTVKLIIVDLDDTLWRGVAMDSNKAESTAEAWRLIEGWPKGLIEALLIFKARGGLISICSKNDETALRSRARNILFNELSFDDFVSVQINFKPKSENIRQILEDTNLLAQSVLMIDDNPREVEEIRAHFPDIRFLSRQHYDWRRVILNSPETQVGYLSVEALKRTDTVKAAVIRRGQHATLTREDWLRSLAIKQTHDIISSTDHSNFKRAAELINKTNQFNTTGKRWDYGEFVQFFSAGGWIITVHVSDRHTDYGLTGCSMLCKDQIRQAVLSCRVFGMDIESQMLSVSVQEIFKTEQRARGQIFDTGRNHTCHDFYLKGGFRLGRDGWFELDR